MLRASLGHAVFPLPCSSELSASVYGIDAYLVEVEVDVGSARMQTSTCGFAGQRGERKPRAHQIGAAKLRV